MNNKSITKAVGTIISGDNGVISAVGEIVAQQKINEKSPTYYFSDIFLAGLQTKSQNFQAKFYDIMDTISKHLGAEKEIQAFQEFIEKNHSYDKPGNLLYSTLVHFCGNQVDANKLREKLNNHILRLFDSFDAADIMLEATHIIVCISTANNALTEANTDSLKSVINFERLCRGSFPALVTTILCSQDVGTSCYIACLK